MHPFLVQFMYAQARLDGTAQHSKAHSMDSHDSTAYSHERK